MKIEIITTKRVKETIDVDFPYYYKQDLCSDYSDTVIYGKIMGEFEVTIKEDESYNGKISYEIEKCFRSDYYFTDEYKSSKEEFEAVKIRALEFLNKC
jgi:hypothetical protein